MSHDHKKLGLHPVHCPLCEGYIRDDESTGDRVVMVELSYPPYETERCSRPNPRVIEVGLMHVRAADNIRISYDFNRDGWAIEQAWTEDVEITTPGATYQSFDSVEHWEEVGFFQAWALERVKGIMQHEEDDDE